MEKATRPDFAVGAFESSDRPALASFYAVAGRIICVECFDAESAELFARYFDGWHVEPRPSSRVAHADATIRVMRAESPPLPPEGFEFFEVSGGGVCHTDGRTYFFESRGSVVRVSAEASARVDVWIGSSPASRESAALARLVFNASMTAMRRCGLFELHGAGLAEPDSGVGYLIVGPSGSGKSTLATQLASAGWRYLSDDSLLLCEASGRVEARALRRVFAVTEPTVALCLHGGYENLMTEPVPFDPLKRRFEPQTIFPRGFVEACVPRAVFFPTITREPASRVRRLTHSETMMRLLRMCPWACYDRPSAVQHLGVLARLARQASGHELFAGTDLLGRADYSARFLFESAGGESR